MRIYKKNIGFLCIINNLNHSFIFSLIDDDFEHVAIITNRSNICLPFIYYYYRFNSTVHLRNTRKIIKFCICDHFTVLFSIRSFRSQRSFLWSEQYFLIKSAIIIIKNEIILFCAISSVWRKFPFSSLARKKNERKICVSHS